MEVQVEVAVDVVKGQAGGLEFFKLGGDFVAQLAAAFPGGEVAPAGEDGVVGELLLGIHQLWNFCGGEGGASADEREVQADAQFGILLRQSDGLGGERFVDHEAGRSQDAFAMGADDSLVDGLGAGQNRRR